MKKVRFIFLKILFFTNLAFIGLLNADEEKNIPYIKEEKLNVWPNNITDFEKQFSEPVIFRGIAKSWKVMDLTYDHMTKKFPNNKFIFGIDEEEEEKYEKCFPDSEESEIDGFFDEKPEGWPLSFGDFWNRVQEGKIKRYYGEIIFDKKQKEVDYLPYNLNLYFSKILEQEKDLPKMFKDASKTTLFVSGPGSVRLTHSHESVLLVQIEGSKIMTFAAPDEASYLYVKYCKNGKDYKYNDKNCVSPVNIRNPNLERFPEFENAQLMQVLIVPGDVIFIPEGWFHEVRALDNSISLSFFYKE